MTVTTLYKAASMAALADNLDQRAKEYEERAPHQGTQVKIAHDRGMARAFEIAASIVRNTTIDPEMAAAAAAATPGEDQRENRPQPQPATQRK